MPDPKAVELARSRWIDGKDRSLGVLSAEPLVLETPVELLAGRRIIEKDSLFVRNVQDLPAGHTLEPLSIDGWEIELAGLIEPRRVVIHAEELLEMDQVEHELVLQCSGNGRSLYGGIPGTPWTQGGVANVRFAGVPLSAVLARHGVAIDPDARYVTAEGRTGVRVGDRPAFEHSLPVADVLARTILALELNGEPLPGIHGGPVRLVTPGFFGTMQLKWLSRLRFEAAESSTFFHANEYRVPLEPVAPGETFRFTLENSRPTWHLKLMSCIFDPRPGATFEAGPVAVSGVAYNDGSVRIASVLVSTDRGETWRAAEIQRPESPFAWHPWSITIELAPGDREVWARAVDELGQTQPLDGAVTWNPNGYEWTGVGRTRLIVR
jgi:DMSO/TMAO reductase YedYZ molybdopterin-dependent catalytic subunit